MPPAARAAESEEPLAAEREASPQRIRRRGPLIGVVTVAAVAVIAGQQHGGRASIARPLPSTPREWVDQWTAASLNDPGRVCGRLFAPALASAFKSDTGRSCVGYYYQHVNGTSFRIRRVLQDGGAAAVEARQVGAARNWGYSLCCWAMLAPGGRPSTSCRAARYGRGRPRHISPS
jgi:hypothetical protein